jgi:hypothetical protein
MQHRTVIWDIAFHVPSAYFWYLYSGGTNGMIPVYATCIGLLHYVRAWTTPQYSLRYITKTSWGSQASLVERGLTTICITWWQGCVVLSQTEACIRHERLSGASDWGTSLLQQKHPIIRWAIVRGSCFETAEPASHGRSQRLLRLAGDMERSTTTVCC